MEGKQRDEERRKMCYRWEEASKTVEEDLETTLKKFLTASTQEIFNYLRSSRISQASLMARINNNYFEIAARILE